MKTKHWVVMILAIVFIPILWFSSLFLAWSFGEGMYHRGDLSAGQQKEIAEALGFDIAPDETLTALYQLRAPGKMDYLVIEISGIPSEEDFLSRCREETLFYWIDGVYGEGEGGAEFCNYVAGIDGYYIPIPGSVEKIIDNQWLFYPVSIVFWGGLVAIPTLLITLSITSIVKHRKSKKENPPCQVNPS